MSKPRPFISSFWGIAIILAIAAIILGTNNYRGHRAGFNLPFTAVAVNPIDTKQLNTFHLVSTAEDFAKLCQLAEPTGINWNEHLAFVAFTPTQTVPISEISPLTVRRNGPTINIDYQLTQIAPEQSSAHLGTAILLDRTKLIASSSLQINLIKDQTITHTLTLAPNQI